jgi:predicted Rossmann fold flavoprotein
LLGPFQRFSARDTVAWFAARGVALKTEADGRMFPITDSSQTIIDCLLGAARRAGVNFRLNCAVHTAVKLADGRFELTLAAERRSPLRAPGPAGLELAGQEAGAPGEQLFCDRLLLATGGCRAAAAGHLAVSLGHTLEPPVPSLFTFQVDSPWLRSLAGVSAEAGVFAPAVKRRERGPLLVTHWGLSGPVVLKLSAWGARALHALNYQFPLEINWLPAADEETLGREFQARRQSAGAKLVANTPVPPLTARLWAELVLAAGVARETRWSALPRAQARALARQLTRTEFSVVGKSLNKDEFVTCGGVKLRDVDFRTMESKLCPGLFFAGELLDIDGLTGGFNFQAAWTTGHLAGRAMTA